MEPRFNSTYYIRIDSKNPSAEYSQINNSLRQYLSYANKNNIENNEIKNNLYQLEFTYSVVKIKNYILMRDNTPFIIPSENEYFEAAHKKGKEFLLPLIAKNPTQNELLFLTAFKFDKKSTLKVIHPEIANIILMSNYCLLDFETFKHSISKVKNQSIVKLNSIVKNPIVTQEKPKSEFCIIC